MGERSPMKRIWCARPVRFVREMVALYFDKRVSRSAAELAYFLILSVFPLVICLNALVGMLRLDLGAILAATGGIVPAGVQTVLGDYLGYISGDQPGLLTAGLVMTLFSGSAAFRALMNSMDDLYGKKRYTGLMQVAVSLFWSALLLATAYLSGVVVLTGEWFLCLLDRVLPVSLSGSSWPWLRFVLLFCMMLFLILLVYRVSAPKGEHPPVLPGAFAAAAALVGASAVFSAFIGMSARYSLVYGSLASVIILMVWLYLCGNILILGNVFNCVLYRHEKEHSTWTP